MEIELTKTESELIIHEIIISLRSIQYSDSREKKKDFRFKGFEKFDKSDFDLEEAELTDVEFKSYFNILKKLKEVSLNSPHD